MKIEKNLKLRFHNEYLTFSMCAIITIKLKQETILARDVKMGTYGE